MSSSIIIDNGSDNIRAGLSTNETPQIVFPSVVGVPKNKSENMGESYVGVEAISKSEIFNLIHPIEHGLITNWDSMEKIWSYVYKELSVSSKEHPVVLSHGVLDFQNRDKMAQIMFETFSTPSLYISLQSTLSLYNSGRTSGVVIDSGGGVTHVVPIYSGTPFLHGIKRFCLAGNDLTQHLQNMLEKRGHSFNTSKQREFVKDIKEKLCYVALDYESESSSPPENFEKSYELPDGQVIKIGEERFKCPESMFNPSLFEIKEGVSTLTFQSIASCDVGSRMELYRNVVLAGGTTLFPGFKERLQKELETIAPSTIKVKVVPTQSLLDSWRGGSIVSSLSTFEKIAISKSQYDEYGPIVGSKKCFC